jgi:MFS family permease
VNTDPRQTLANAPMSALQILVVALTIGLNGLDGFDVLSISLSANSIAKEWALDDAVLAFVQTMELFGMVIGSIVLGGVADRYGRRLTTLWCLVVMTFGMAMVANAPNWQLLSLWRVMTGLGIGGLLASTNALAAEFSSSRRRDMNVSLMAMGYPFVAFLGGLAAAWVLGEYHNWRYIVGGGAVATALFIPLVYFFVPESVSWLCRKQPAGALERVNATLKRMGHAAIEQLPENPSGRKYGLSDLFSGTYVRTTVLVAAAYFLHIGTFYFLLKGTPRLGHLFFDYGVPQAAGALGWANLGGAIGGVLIGLLAMALGRWMGIKGLTIVFLLLGAVGINYFGNLKAFAGDSNGSVMLSDFILTVATTNLFLNGGVSGLYAIMAKVFPTHLRAVGTGFTIGMGRLGSILAVSLTGILIKAQLPFPTIAMIMSVGSVLSCVTIWMINTNESAEH